MTLSPAVDAYIAAQPEKVAALLKKFRATIHKAAPGAEEVLSYGVPAYKFHGMLVYFAARKDFYSFYPYPSAIAAFKEQLNGYQLSPGTVRLEYNKPFPSKLISDMVKFRATENLDKFHTKELAKSMARKITKKKK